MQGNPESFDAIGNRLGFSIAENNSQRLRLIWRGPRFPAYLCLSIAILSPGVIITEPLFGSISPLRILRNVLFPAPLAPITP